MAAATSPEKENGGYKSKTQSIISACDRGSRDEQLNNPRGVTIDHSTGNIYVADQLNHCVKVFNNTAKYMFKFGDNRGEGKMYYPTGLVICCNTVLISQSNDHILVYQLDGKFVSRIGSSGSGDLQFKDPFGLTTDESNNDIYICDCNNNRIQIISQNFQYKSQFGKNLLHCPRGIKLYKDNIFIIDTSNPCLHIFHKDLELQKSVITRGRGQQVINPWFFFIDRRREMATATSPENENRYYKSKTQSIISVCNRGCDNGQLNYPLGVTIDHNTGNIYVVDQRNHCVDVFDNTAEYLFKFGDSKGEGKMQFPTGLAISCNTVLISQCDDHILVYQLDGKFVSKIGTSGSGDLQFNFPFGLTTDETNNDIYICDRSNNRIQIISQNFQYKSQFGKDLLYIPRDIKLYKDNIFIIDQSNPCLHIFNKDLELQRSVITRGRGQQVLCPCFFFIDKFGNILISDYNSNSILILNSEFELIHKISTSDQPTGITMDKEDRIIVVCNSDNNCLQIF